MIYQTATTSWLLGVGIMFGLAFLMTVLTFKDIESFFIFLTIFSGFVVYAGLLPFSILVICFIITLLIIINNIRKNRVV